MFQVEQLFHVKHFGCFELCKSVRTCSPPRRKKERNTENPDPSKNHEGSATLKFESKAAPPVQGDSPQLRRQSEISA